MTIQEKQLSMQEKDLQRLNELCLMDDDFRYLKETEGGKGQMSRILEEMREEAAKEAATKAEHKKAVETAQKMLARGRDTVEDIAEITGLTLKEVQELAS